MNPTRTPGKCGKLAPVTFKGVKHFHQYFSKTLPTPPAELGYLAKFYQPNIPFWPMSLNDQYGCCVVAGQNHSMQASRAVLGLPPKFWDDATVKQVYFANTGGADTGLNIGLFLGYMQASGVLGDKVAAFAPVSCSDLVCMKQTIQIFGSLKVGVQLPQSAQDQFSQGVPWSVVPGSPIEGGHDIEFVDYSDAAGAFLAVTWGAYQWVDYDFWNKFGDEAWAQIWQNFIDAGHGPIANLDVAGLQADLAAVST